MKITLPQNIETKTNPISRVKRIIKSGFNYVSNMFERTPASDIFVHTNGFSKPNLSETDKKYIETINNVPVLGVGKEEQPILKIVQESMFQMLKRTDGEATPYNEILFAHGRDPHAVASVYSGANTLCVNKSYLENIDSIIKETLSGLEVMRWITKDKNGQYKIPDFMRNKRCEQFEKLLNEYTPEWPLKDKFLFDTTNVSYYINFAFQIFHNTAISIERILKYGNNEQVLKEQDLLKTSDEIKQMHSWERDDYLEQIAKYCVPQEDLYLIRYPGTIFNHEYIHNWCFDNFSEDYLKELHSKPVLEKWKNDEQTQIIANKVSLRAADNPMEYIAEVGAGLAEGQKFDNDVMLLYKSLKGPKL